jgi:hypothetical protein
MTMERAVEGRPRWNDSRHDNTIELENFYSGKSNGRSFSAVANAQIHAWNEMINAFIC